MSKPRKYPMPDYKVPEGMVIVGYMNRVNEIYTRFYDAAKYNERWYGEAYTPLPVYAFINGNHGLNT